MPPFMDTHRFDGSVAVEVVAKAHMADLQVRGKHDVSYLRYGVAEPEGGNYCLVEVPSADAAFQVHKEAHGLLADDIFQAKEAS